MPYLQYFNFSLEMTAGTKKLASPLYFTHQELCWEFDFVS